MIEVKSRVLEKLEVENQQVQINLGLFGVFELPGVWSR